MLRSSLTQKLEAIKQMPKGFSSVWLTQGWSTNLLFHQCHKERGIKVRLKTVTRVAKVNLIGTVNKSEAST